MKEPQPILVTHLFPEILDALIRLLKGLKPEDWSKPTVCAGWTVKDVTQHLLAVDISNISRKRDNHYIQPTSPIHTDQDLLEFINFLNQSWMHATQRISSQLLIELLQFVGTQANDFFTSLDPFKLGDPVSWAGPDPAPIWLDLAREYTERWHHQQHIRDAVGKPGLKEPRFFAPILDAFVRALPNTYQGVEAIEGTLVTLTITGDSGGQWSIRCRENQWKLYVGMQNHPDVQVIIDQDDAWRLFTKGIGPNEVRDRSTIEGDRKLSEMVFEMVSIIA